MHDRSQHRWLALRRWSGLLALVLCTVLLVSNSRGQEKDDTNRELAKAEAVVLWVGLTVIAVLILGVGLIWGVSRGAKRILRMRPPTNTEMTNIWYLNPPEKRKQEDRE